jgi:hypothetical protein
MLLGVALLAAGCEEPIPTDTIESRAVETVRSYVGRNLADASDDELRRLCEALCQLDATRDPVENGKIFGFGPRFVWEFGRAEGQTGYLIFESRRYMPHPSTQPIRLTLIDAAGVVRAKSEIRTGWRRYLNTAKLTSSGDIAEPVLVVECHEFGISPVCRDYYALLDGRFELIHAENHDGTPGRDNYHLMHTRRGPSPPRQSEKQWEADLCSNERARVLRALVWLGGRHLLPPGADEKADSQYEREEDAALVRRVRARCGTAAQLRALATSQDDWVREGARLALAPEDVERW